MRRLRLLIAPALIAGLALPAGAAARFYELGAAADNPAPSCPPIDSCRVVTRATVYQVRSGTVTTPVTAPHGGRLVAFTVRVGDMKKKNIHFFNSHYGGTPRVALSILRKVKGKKLRRSVVAVGGEYHLQPFFGTTAQFALHRSIAVRKDDIVALTVRTWAPILAVGLGTTDQWRTVSPAGSKCTDLTVDRSLPRVGAFGRFGCTFTTQRLTYSVTLVGNAKRKYDKKQNPIKKT